MFSINNAFAQVLGRLLSRRQLAVGAAVAVPLLAAHRQSIAQVSGEAFVWGGNPARTGEMPGPGPVVADGIEAIWKVSDLSNSTVAVADNVVIRLNNDLDNYTMTAYDARTGAERWTFVTELKGGSRGEAYAPTIHEGVVYSSWWSRDDGSWISLIDIESGSEIGRWKDDANCDSSFTIYERLLIAGLEDGVVAYSIDKQGIEWIFESNNFRNAAPSVYDGSVYFGDRDGYVYSVNAADGSERWRYKTDEVITGTPSVSGGTVIVGGENGGLYVIGDDGLLKWKKGIGVMLEAVPVAASSERIFTVSSQGLLCLDLQSGDLIWQYDTRTEVDYSAKTAPVLSDGVVWIVAGQRGEVIYGLSQGDGTVLEGLGKKADLLSQLVVRYGNLYVASNDEIACYGNGEPITPTPEPAVLGIDGHARVNTETVLRAGPATSALDRGLLPEGTEVQLIDGPVDGDGGPWWNVAVIDAELVGWLPESSLTAL